MSTHQTSIDRRTPIDDLPQYLTVDEFAQYMAVGRSSAYEYLRTHGVRIGRLLRLPRERLAAEAQ